MNNVCDKFSITLQNQVKHHGNNFKISVCEKLVSKQPKSVISQVNEEQCNILGQLLIFTLQLVHRHYCNNIGSGGTQTLVRSGLFCTYCGHAFKWARSITSTTDTEFWNSIKIHANWYLNLWWIAEHFCCIVGLDRSLVPLRTALTCIWASSRLGLENVMIYCLIQTMVS